MNTVYNVTTRSGNRIEYHTDASGRVAFVRTDIREHDLDQGIRNCYQQRVTGNCGLGSDEGGHLIATKLGGPGEAINLVPQDKNLNRGDWQKMERKWAAAAANGKEVSVAIKVEYDPAVPDRPSGFKVFYAIDGKPFQESFKNQPRRGTGP